MNSVAQTGRTAAGGGTCRCCWRWNVSLLEVERVTAARGGTLGHFLLLFCDDYVC